METGDNHETIADEINIYYKTISGETLEMKSNKSMTIKELITKYNNEAGITGNVQTVFTYKGKILSQDKKLEDYDINEEEVVHVVLRLPGGFK